MKTNKQKRIQSENRILPFEATLDPGRKDEKPMKKSYKIEVDCANCANNMEIAAKKTAGVKDAVVNFMTQKMSVEFEEGADVNAVMKDVVKNCKKAVDDGEIFL